MPDPVLYLEAMSAALGVSAIIALALGWTRSPATATRLNVACTLGLNVGLIVGYLVLRMRPAWPPTNGLGRCLLIILPAVCSLELLANLSTIPRRAVWLLRGMLSLAIGRVLLHNSVYLSGQNSEWTAGQAGIVLCVCGVLLAAEWSLLVKLSQRSPGTSLPLALAMSIQCGGIAVMLAGYVSGGAAAIPIAAAIAGCALVAGLMRTSTNLEGVVGIGTVSLFSLLFVARFFGKVSTEAALAMMLAPLLCWGGELPWLKHRNRWVVGGIRLMLVFIPLLVVLMMAKLKFNRETLPLL